MCTSRYGKGSDFFLNIIGLWLLWKSQTLPNKIHSCTDSKPWFKKTNTLWSDLQPHFHRKTTLIVNLWIVKEVNLFRTMGVLYRLWVKWVTSEILLYNSRGFLFIGWMYYRNLNSDFVVVKGFIGHGEIRSLNRNSRSY